MIIGLTGSIAMGKSTAARAFAKAGAHVRDSDREVHALYEEPSFITMISDAFPGITTDEGRLDRTRLARQVFADPDLLLQLERLVHPIVRKREYKMVAQAQSAGIRFIILEIPLLFEAGRAHEMDAVITVTAPPDIQRRRALARPSMTPERFAAICARQVPCHEKIRQSHFVIHSAWNCDSACGGDCSGATHGTADGRGTAGGRGTADGRAHDMPDAAQQAALDRQIAAIMRALAPALI